jgi:signal transduction histidine kinase
MENTGILFTSLVSFLIFLSAFFLGAYVYNKRRFLKNAFEMRQYSFFLFATAGVWFFVAIRLLFAWAENDYYNKILFIADQIFVFISGLPIAGYLALRIFKNRFVFKITLFIYFLALVLGVYSLFTGEITEVGTTYFASKLQVCDFTFGLFMTIILPLLWASFYDTVSGIIAWLKSKKTEDPFGFVYSSIIMVYLALGIFDEKGFIAGYELVFFRLLFVAVFLAAFVNFHFQFVKSGADSTGQPTPLTGAGSASASSSARKGVIFRRVVILLIFLSLIPVTFASFLIITSYNTAISSIESCGDVSSLDIAILRENVTIQVFLVLLLLVILVLFAGILAARSITRPISILLRGVKEIAGGNLDVRFNIKSDNELGDLAEAFNEMAQKLKDQREREQLVARLKTEFISIAAHQLRTPLSSVKWILKMLLEGDFGALNEQQKEFVEKGYESNDRMIHLVNDLLDASRIEEGRFGFQFVVSDLKEFLSELVNEAEVNAREKKIVVEADLPQGEMRLIFDPNRLKLALSNLLDNAIHYTPEGGKVRVSAKTVENFIKVSVSDTGVGIPESQKSRVFSKFFRADNVIRLQTEGTGLGLYLAKNIIEKHGGKIWFESIEGKGTTFYFTLPVARSSVNLSPFEN